MSFDVSMNCKHCGSAVADFNITHNVNSIVDACLVEAAAALNLPEPKSRIDDSAYAARSWGRLAGWTGADALPILKQAVTVATDPKNKTRFREWEPPNGWGDLAGVIECLALLRDACERNPGSVISADG